jgi:hypothetical protein
MSGNTLSTLRIVIPGTILFINIIALLLPELTLSLLNPFREWYNLAALLVIPVLGVIYSWFPFRKWIWQLPRSSLDENIKAKLLEPFSKALTQEEKKRLQNGNVLLHIFYNLVDADDSLKEKAGKIRLNGLICTTIADIVALGILGCISFIIGYAFLHRLHYIWLSIVMLILVLICFLVALPRFMSNHQKLSNEQIEALLVNYKTKLGEKFRDFLDVKDD